MSKLILLLFFYGGYLGASAQSVSCTESVKGSKDLSGVEVVHSDSNGFYVLEQNRKEQNIRLTRYDFRDMKPQWSETVALPAGENDVQFEKIIFLGDKFLLFTTSFSKSNEQFQIFCTYLDAKGKKTNEPALVHYTLSEGREGAPRFGLILSPDSSRMLLYFDPPFERKSTEALAFKCYDADLDMIWEKDILLPYTQDIVQVHSFLIDNVGNIYMMSGRNPQKRGAQWQKPQGGRYVVFYYGFKENKLKEYDVSLKDKQVLSVVFILSKEQEVYITGYYSNDYKFSAAGTFLFSIGAYGNAVKAASFMPFPKDFLHKFLRDSQVENDATLPDFYLDHMTLNADGSMILIGEQYYASEYVTTDAVTGRQIIEYRYNFDDIICSRLEPNGRQQWNLKIPKRQYISSDLEYCSYMFFETPDGAELFFNDHTENDKKLAVLKEGDATAWTGSRNSVITKIKIENSGTFRRESILSNKETNSLLRPESGEKNVNGTRLLAFEDSRSYKFCVVK